MTESSLSPLASPRGRRAACLAGLGLFLLLQGWALGRHIRRETRPPPWDQSIHLETAFDYKAALGQGRLKEAWRLPPKPGMPQFPPLYHLALAPAMSAQDPARAALWANWAYLAFLTFAVFAISWHFKPDDSAAAAALAFAAAPLVQDLLRTQLIDLPLTAWVAAAYWALLASDRFRRPWESAAFGLAAAAGMMHKWSFFSYLLPAAWIGWTALFDPAARRNAVMAAVLAAAGTVPWYASHLPALLPRLVEASADRAVPFWREAAFLKYFFTIPTDIGPLLWLLGCIALLVPVASLRHENTWILTSWLLSSYAFWTVVPNRQGRFLLPGLVPMAVLASTNFPRPLVWAAAVLQLAAAANYGAGWIKPVTIPFPLTPLSLFQSAPPVTQDWRIEDVLKEARRRHLESPAPKAAPSFSNVTLVFNHSHFNGCSFSWTAKRLGITELRLRGVNRRLCELSRFLVVKTGSLGPESVIHGLPQARDAVLKPGGWVERAYSEAARWPLPDGSEALLYEQRRPTEPPFRRSESLRPEFESGNFRAKGLKVRLEGWDPGSSLYRRILVDADVAGLRGLEARGVGVEFEDALAVPASTAAAAGPIGDVRFLRIGRLKVRSLSIEADSLKSFLESRVKGLEVRRVRLQGTAWVSGAWRGLPFWLEAEIALRGRALAVTWKHAGVGFTPLPLRLLGRHRILEVPLDPTPETPFFIDIPGVSLVNGRLSVP